ncbi:MAG: DNA polymerase III subunit alpha, partial [Clostridiaceae bacterium]|nr:DNA polymerase III subunit alpha [Clostridiaceae bacterium]
VVWDFIRFAHSRDIMVGPGRGSGAGSLAAWCLGITNIDPLQYSLIFERFLNAERVSLPDFDIDFCYERRPEVIDYVTEKYGHDHVAQVITFGTLAARAVIRDVARALDVPYAEADRIAKMVPTTLGITIRKALESNPELRQDYQQNSVTREVLDNAMRFEGMPRHASTHAAGVVISSQPLTDLVPLARNEDAIVVQFDKNNVELIGLLKFDFLGLRTLTVLRDTAEMVLKNHGTRIDYDRLPMDDKRVFAMISEGSTDGVFQLESQGMTSFMKELQPESLEDIIAGISLYRPGPMEQIPRYVAARHDHGKIRYDHPFLEPILNVTYGCIVYQEQVMQIVRDLAGFSMGQSDNVRRAMSKKKPDELAQYKSLFLYGGRDEKGNPVPGAVARGVSLDIAEKIFEDVMAFAGYAFNKSHAASYAVVSYFTAWLKYYYPVEFMAAILNSYLGSLSQAARYVRVCQKMGIRVLPPDINQSDARFTTEKGQIRFALAAVKNVGAAAIGKLIRERQEDGPFKSYGDFLRRLNETEINRKMIESLIRSSALDFFGIPRSQLIAVLDVFTARLNHARRLNMEGQLSLFELAPAPANIDAEPDYPAIPEFDRAELLAMEKEMLGLYVTGHPLNEYTAVIGRLTTLDSSAFADMGPERLVEVENEAMVQPAIADGDRVIMAGMLADRKNKTTRSNELMSFLTIEDLFGQYEVLVFPKVLTASAEVLATAKVLLISGRLSIREDDVPKLVADQIAELAVDATRLPEGFFSRETLPNRRSRSPSIPETQGIPVVVDMPSTKRSPAGPDPSGRYRLAIRYQGLPDDQGYQQLLATLAYFRGTTPVHVYLPSVDQTVQLPHNYWVELSDAVLSILVDRYGQDNLGIISP